MDEVIIATNPTIEGEATAVYLSGLLRRAGLKVTRGEKWVMSQWIHDRPFGVVS